MRQRRRFHQDHKEPYILLSPMIDLIFLQTENNIVPDIEPWHEPRFLEHKGGLVGAAPENLTAVGGFQTAGEPQQSRFSAAALT